MNKFLIISILIISVFTTSCAVEKSSESNKSKNLNYNSNSKPVKGGVLKLFSTYPDTLNPLISKNSFIKDYSPLVYEGLFRISNEQKPLPMLIDSYSVSNDNLTWTFKIKDNIFWHNGVSFSANDIQFTFTSILSQTSDSIYKSNLSDVSSYSVEDKNTFKLILNKQDNFLPWKLTFPILSETNYSSKDEFEKDNVKVPIGTGPYKITEYIPNSSIKLSVNDKWVNKISGQNNLPYIDMIEIKLYQDMSSIHEAFSSGNVDLIKLETGMWDNYVGRRDITLQKFISNDFEFLAFNLNGNSWISDKSVRSAINTCIDRVDIINSSISGNAVPWDLPIYPESWLNEGSTISFFSSAIHAKEILEKGGWKFDKSNGLYYKLINGVVSYLRINLIVNEENSKRKEIANKIKAQLKECGIGVEVVSIGTDLYMSTLKNRSYEMAIAGIKTLKYPDLTSLYTENTSGLNISGLNDVEINNLIFDYTNTNDLNKKKDLLRVLRTNLQDKVPYAGLYFYYDSMIYNKKFSWTYEPHNWNILNDFTKWYIKE